MKRHRNKKQIFIFNKKYFLFQSLKNKKSTNDGLSERKVFNMRMQIRIFRSILETKRPVLLGICCFTKPCLRESHFIIKYFDVLTT